ncbi:MAG TPA: protease pro-enzyme activation domain-containing protein, partial [Candidatus Elarobacter sp.]
MQPVAFARRAAAFILAGALAACGGGGGSHSALPGTTGTGGTTPITPSSALTQTLKPTPKFASSATKAGAVSESTLLMHVVVNLRDAAGLADYAAGASTPGDPRYRQFLTASQIGDRFGATQSDTATVAQYLASYGLHVAAYPQRLGLTVSGATTNFAKAFGTTFATYTMNNGHPVTAPVGTITFAKPLPVEGISDAIFDPAAKHTQFVQGAVGGPQSNSTGGNSPQQIATAFDYTGAYNAGYTGAGVTIGIIGTGGIDQHDFATFKSLYSWPSTGTLTQVNVTSAAAANTYTGAVNYGGSPTASPPPVTAPCRGGSAPRPTPTCNPEDLEAQIDTEQASLAPGANINFYLAYVPSECYDPTTNSCGPPNPNTGTGYTYQGLYESDDEIQQA